MSKFHCCCPPKYGKFSDRANMFAFRWSTGEALWQYHARCQPSNINSVSGAVAMIDGHMWIFDHGDYLAKVDPEGQFTVTDIETPHDPFHVPPSGPQAGAQFTTADGTTYLLRKGPPAFGTSFLLRVNSDGTFDSIRTVYPSWSAITVSGNRILQQYTPTGSPSDAIRDLVTGEDASTASNRPTREYPIGTLLFPDLYLGSGTNKTWVRNWDYCDADGHLIVELTNNSGHYLRPWAVRSHPGFGYTGPVDDPRAWPTGGDGEYWFEYWCGTLVKLTSTGQPLLSPVQSKTGTWIGRGDKVPGIGGSGEIVYSETNGAMIGLTPDDGLLIRRGGTSNIITKLKSDQSIDWSMSIGGWTFAPSVLYYNEQHLLLYGSSGDSILVARVDPVTGAIIWQRKMRAALPVCDGRSGWTPGRDVFVSEEHDIMVYHTYGSPITTGLELYWTF